jgi:hypothetical protein
MAILLGGKDAAGIRRQACDVAAAVAWGMDRSNLPGQLLALRGALEPAYCRLPAQRLVDLLKHPQFVGQARRVVLEQLEHRYRGKFVDQWDFVRFAQEKKLGLDFTTPPRRPAPLR